MKEVQRVFLEENESQRPIKSKLMLLLECDHHTRRCCSINSSKCTLLFYALEDLEIRKKITEIQRKLYSKLFIISEIEMLENVSKTFLKQGVVLIS